MEEVAVRSRTAAKFVGKASGDFGEWLVWGGGFRQSGTLFAASARLGVNTSRSRRGIWRCLDQVRASGESFAPTRPIVNRARMLPRVRHRPQAAADRAERPSPPT